MYTILSLDGGGSWAILQLLTLREKYGDVSGHEILRHFDLVIANSGGSIVLAALAEGWTINQALKLFDDKEIREEIFYANSFKDRFFPVDYLRLLFNVGPKYSTTKKGAAFRRLFPQVDKRQMIELPEYIGKPSLHLIVCTFDALNNKAKFFKSYRGDDQPFDSIRLTQAIDGSSNAPVQYFDFPARFKAKESEIFYELWDGALGGFNNPVAAGVIEAFKLGVSIDEIKIISIGTGNRLMSMDDKSTFYTNKQITIENRRKKFAFRFFKSQLRYFKEMVFNQAKTILYQPPDWGNYVAYMFLAKSASENLGGRFIRLSPMIHFDQNTPSEVETLINKLYALDMDITDDAEVNLLKECFDVWRDGKIKNQPIAFKIMRDNTLKYIYGQEAFEDGLRLW